MSKAPVSYLTIDENGPLTAQITRLLRDESTDNCPLILELISGGGTNRRLLGYLFGISIFHTVPEVAAKAQQLLESRAGKDTLLQARKLKESAGYYYNESEYFSKFDNPEFDLFDFLLAHKMCIWHGSHVAGNPYAETAHRTLNLSQFSGDQFSPAVAQLDFTRYLSLPEQKDFDINGAIAYMEHWPLETIFIEKNRLEFFPTAVFKLKKLQNLSICRGPHRPRSPMQVPEGAYGNASLQKLVLDGYMIHNSERLGPFPNLRSVSITRCNLTNLDFLKDSPLLETLMLKNNLLESAPAFIGTFKNLKVLDLSENPLRRIDIDLREMPLLESIDISSKYK